MYYNHDCLGQKGLMGGIEMTRNRIVSFMVAVITLFCVAGMFACKKEDEQNAKTTYITVWIHKSKSDDEGKIYSTVTDEFNEAGHKTSDGKRDLKIKLEYKGTPETLQSSISSEMLTGGLPDVIAIDAVSYAAYASEQVIVPIDEYVTTEDRAEYLDSVIDAATINGKLYGLTGQEGPGGLYYNNEMITDAVLAEAGLGGFGTVENPWSWKDVKKVLEVLRKKDKSNNKNASQIKLNLGFGGDEGCMWLYSSLVYSAGGIFAENEVLDGYMNSAKAVAGLAQMEMFFKKDGGINYSYSGANEDAFAQGVVPMSVFGAWDILTINREYPEMNGKYGIMPMPVYEDEKGNKGVIASPCGSWGFAVTKDARRATDAVTVIKYLTGEYCSQMMFDGIGAMPANVNVLKNSPEFNEDGPYRDLRLLLDVTVPRPKLIKYPQCTVAFGDIIEYIETMSGDESYDLQKYVNSKVSAII